MSADPYIVAGHIRANLRTIRDHYAAALTHEGAADESGVRSSGQAGEPVNLHAIDVRRDTMTDLAFWCRFILDEVNSGTITTATVDAHSPDSMGVFIDTWALALAEQLPDDADNLAKESRDHGHRLEMLAKGWRTKRIGISGCPERILTVTDGVEEIKACTGGLWAMFSEDDEGMLPGRVACDATPDHEWTPWQWRDLGRRIGTSVA